MNFENFETFFKQAIKLPLNTTTKTPKITGWNSAEYNETLIKKASNTDIGIITGAKNNLLVLDVDVKDDGINEINNYIKQFGIIDTLTIKSPSGGLHYYFKYNSSSDSVNCLIKNNITNRAKYRGKGLDIRTNGGYVKAPPSTGYNIILDTEIKEINESLLIWLLEDIELYEKDIKQLNQIANKKIIVSNNYKYNITAEQLTNILNSLDNVYNDNYNKWLLVLTICKNLNNTFNTYKIFDTWSKQNKKKYDKANNLKIWNSNKGNIDINFLTTKLKQPIITKFKPIENKLNLEGWNQLNLNIPHLNFSFVSIKFL